MYFIFKGAKFGISLCFIFQIYPVILPKASSPETIRLLRDAGYQGANLKDGLSSFVEDFTRVMRNVFLK